ncbi:MAG: alpha/beta hydrolase fold protein [Solirubrobacterales bacterium]|nr:alpha/beta hydrolase fold protein [Solirubrobacterales bacterium]
MPEIELTAGTIEYEDTGGEGPTIVFLHGLLNDSSLWRNVVPGLRDAYRCVLPTTPLGGHRRPMKPDADLTIRGQVRLVAEFLERLDLRDVTLVGNDWGGAQMLVSEGLDERLGRLVLSSCEAFDNYPPGLPGKNVALAAKIPGGINLAVQSLRIRALRRLPMTLGWMSKRVPDEVIDAWLEPVQRDKAIRRDLRKYALTRFTKADMREWVERQRAFDRPVLVAWASEDRVMPPEHGRRLAELFPNGRLVEIADSYTFIPEDQPAALTTAIREFVENGA